MWPGAEYGDGAQWRDDPWRVWPRHSGGAVVGFHDGHAKWVRIEKIINHAPGDPACLFDRG